MSRLSRGDLREHGPVGAVVILTVLGVLAYGAVSDGSSASTPTDLAAPISAPAATPAEAVVTPTTAASRPSTGGTSGSGAARPAATGSAGDGGGSPAPTAGPTAPPADPATIDQPPAAPTAPSIAPLPDVPPGALSPLQQVVVVACTAAFAPFALPTTALGLVGAAVPLTLPQLPFELLIAPTSDVCLALEQLVG
jgi:hypothetical protein